MTEATIRQRPLKLTLDPELAALGERISNPQDLNDALLAVKTDEHVQRLSQFIKAQIVNRKS